MANQQRLVEAILLPSLASLFLSGPALSQDREPSPFDAANIVLDDEFSRIDALVDINWDGVMDGVGFFVSPDDALKGELRTFINDGKGRFSATVLASLDIVRNQPVNQLVVGDWNGDGHDDFALLGSAKMLSYLSKGADQPLPYGLVALNSDPLSLAVGDFDDDGKDDIAALSLEGLRIHDHGLVASTLLPSPLGILLAGEFTGDDVIDIGLEGLGRLQIIRHDPDLDSYVDGPEYLHPSMQNALVSVGDIDRDGDTDVTFFGPQSYIVMRRTGSQTFQVEAQVAGGPAEQLIDVDGDGDLDGVCCGGGGGTPVPSRNRERNYFHIAINDSPNIGSNSFRPAVRVPSLGARHLAGASDIDGDGRIDLVAGRSVLFGRDELPGDMKPMSVNNTWLVHDLDMDGDPDFDFGLNNAQFNAGDGAFNQQAPRMPAPPAGGIWKAPYIRGDFDADGAVDMIVGHYVEDGGFQPPFKSMRFLRNCGGGHFVDAGPAGADGDYFKPPAPFGAGFNNAPPFLIADMNADGVNDIAANTAGAAFSPDTVWVWHNDGSGFFTRVISYEGSLVLAAANFDGDAYGDLILGSSSAYFLRRGGPSGYEPAVQIGTRFRASIPVVGNLNGDAYPDLFGIQGSGSGLGSSDPTIFFGGPSAFVDVQTIEGVVLESASGSTPFGLFTGDIDGDGRGDLAINATGGSNWGLGAWTALQDDQGGFAFVRQYLDLQQLADLDGDGDLDVVGDLQVANLTESGASAGYRQQYGLPSAGTDGIAPTLGATGPFRAGETLDLHFSGGLGGTVGVYWIGAGSSDQSLAGLNINIWPLRTSRRVILDGENDEAGGGNALRSHPLPLELMGSDLFLQAFFLDPLGPLGISASNGLQLSIGH